MKSPGAHDRKLPGTFWEWLCSDLSECTENALALSEVDASDITLTYNYSSPYSSALLCVSRESEGSICSSVPQSGVIPSFGSVILAKTRQ